MSLPNALLDHESLDRPLEERKAAEKSKKARRNESKLKFERRVKESDTPWTDRFSGLGKELWKKVGGVKAIERERKSWGEP